MDQAKLGLLREQIDQCDVKILELLDERARIVKSVGKLKSDDPQGVVYVPRRERDILDNLRKQSAGEFPVDSIPVVFREIISACRSLETKLNIAYMGPPASFHHAAAIKKFGNAAEFLSYEHISFVFRAVERGECQYGVVALENSTEGVIAATLDSFQRSDLKICTEIFLDIHHHLVSHSPRAAIKRIYSHGQAFAQCREWLERHFPSAEYVEVSSTSHGAELAAREPATAAISSELASRIYHIPIIESNIEDHVQNTTRFVVVGSEMEPPSGRDKTSLIIYLRNEPGTLYKALKPFNEAGINMTHLEARPTKEQRWQYLFFIEFQGHIQDETIMAALRRIDEIALRCKILGSYPEEERSRLPSGVEDPLMV